MARIKQFFAGSLTLFAIVLVGCGEPQHDMAGEQGMKPPERPKQLDALKSFVGRWEGTSEMRMPGVDKPMKGTGVNEVRWACDGRFLMESFQADLGEGNKMTGIGLWTWDAEHKKYHTWWFDNFGTSGEGWVTYNEADKSWHHQASGENVMAGKHTYGEGTSRFVDDNTIEWTWKEWDNALKWGKAMMEMTGTQHRK